MNNIKVAVIPGDGIGKEVMPEGMRALEAAGSKHGLNFEWTEFDWSCETYLKTGHMMPEDGIEQLRAFDSIYLGADVGFRFAAIRFLLKTGLRINFQGTSHR